MANLKFLENVVHNGILVDKGMVVSDAERELQSVAQSLIDRKLAEVSNESATHSLTLVDNAAKAISVTNAAGQAPQTASDEARKAEAKANQVAADQATQNAVNDQANKEAAVKVVNPNPEVIAAEAAQIK